jgi:RNA polymerase sigma factor (sigma-70 family)
MNKEEEFVKLIQANQGLIYKVASIYTRDRDEQQDLCQEIIYQTWKSFEYFRKASKPSTWLYRVGMNTAITHLNKEKRGPKRISISELKVDFADEMDSGNEEKIQELYSEIRRLNLLDRGIVFLFLEGKSHEEIAEIMGLSTSNVGTKMSRIREKLKKRITNK